MVSNRPRCYLRPKAVVKPGCRSLVSATGQTSFYVSKPPRLLPTGPTQQLSSDIKQRRITSPRRIDSVHKGRSPWLTSQRLRCQMPKNRYFRPAPELHAEITASVAHRNDGAWQLGGPTEKDAPPTRIRGARGVWRNRSVPHRPITSKTEIWLRGSPLQRRPQGAPA